MIDDEKDITSILNKYLSDEGYSVYEMSGGDHAAAEAAKIVPDIILLDVRMPGKDGYEVKAELNQNPITANIPVIFLSASATTFDKITGLRLRADDYVTKPFEIQELLARMEAILNRRKRYEEISMKDELTGLPNAHFFKKELALAFNMAKRYGRIFTVGFIDINNFKEINDTYGHLTGNCVLKEAAKRMGLTLRNLDILSRYGGDEFCLIMQEAKPEQARAALNRTKLAVEGSPFQGLNGDGKFPISISVGMVTYQDRFSGVEELIELADKNMYRNKKIPAAKEQKTKKSEQSVILAGQNIPPLG